MTVDPNLYDSELTHYIDMMRERLNTPGFARDVRVLAERAAYAGDVLSLIRNLTGCSVGEELAAIQKHADLFNSKPASKTLMDVYGAMESDDEDDR